MYIGGKLARHKSDTRMILLDDDSLVQDLETGEEEGLKDDQHTTSTGAQGKIVSLPRRD